MSREAFEPVTEAQASYLLERVKDDIPGYDNKNRGLKLSFAEHKAVVGERAKKFQNELHLKFYSDGVDIFGRFRYHLDTVPRSTDADGRRLWDGMDEGQYEFDHGFACPKSWSHFQDLCHRKRRKAMEDLSVWGFANNLKFPDLDKVKQVEQVKQVIAAHMYFRNWLIENDLNSKEKLVSWLETKRNLKFSDVERYLGSIVVVLSPQEENVKEPDAQPIQTENPTLRNLLYVIAYETYLLAKTKWSPRKEPRAPPTNHPDVELVRKGEDPYARVQAPKRALVVRGERAALPTPPFVIE